MKNVESVIKECIKLSFEDGQAFPEIVRRLKEVGVERYYVDLVRLEKTYYCEDGKTYREKLPLKDPGSIGEGYSEEGVKGALKALEKGEIDYAEFLRRMMKSGIASCIIFMKSEEVQHFGRKGERWVEKFPKK